jgi:CARDB
VSRHRPSRTHVLLGLVVVLLATIPVIIPLLVTKSGPEGPVGVRLASGPPQPAVTENAPAPAAGDPSAATAPPARAGTLVPAPATTSASPSPTGATTPPAPSPAPSSSAASSSAAGPEPSTAEPTVPSPTADASVLDAAANLVVVDVSWTPQPSGAGQPVVFSALVRNTGAAATPPLPTGVAFSVDGTVVSWSGSDSTPLGPGDQRTFTADDGVTGAAWTATDGDHAVEATVDDTGQIPELNEDDNTASAQIVVP